MLFAGAAAFLAIPVLQLLPVPPAVWQSLPGRQQLVDVLALLGREGEWHPITISPARTFASLISLIPPFVMLYFVSRLPLVDRTRLLWLLVALALLSGIVGMLQLVSGNANWFRFYYYTHYGYVTGFQANRNAAADIFLIGIAACAAIVAIRRDLIASWLNRLLFTLVLLFLALATVLTGSRAGTVLLLVVALAIAVMLLPRGRAAARDWGVAAIAALGLAGGAFWLAQTAQIGRTLDRFDGEMGLRAQLWMDTRYALEQVWPVGSGMGTFNPVYLVAERLEAVRVTNPNRAHNDYLEFALEAGVAGLALLVAIFIAIGWRFASILRNRPRPELRAQALFAMTALVVMGLHSIVDYPMRSMSLAVIAAVAVAMLGGVALERMPRKRDGTGAQEGRGDSIG